LQITDLNLARNDITFSQEHLTHLTRTLSNKHSTLHSLNLCHNDFGDDMCHLLGDCLQGKPTLNALDLSACHLTL
jgi:hypothetical protein